MDSPKPTIDREIVTAYTAATKHKPYVVI